MSYSGKKLVAQVMNEMSLRDMKWNKKIWSKLMEALDVTTRKCVLVHSKFHWILSEFGHFYLVKLFNLLMNEDQLL